MSSAILWIVFPGSVAVLLFLLRRWTQAVAYAATALALLLAWAAWLLPIAEPIELGITSLKISDTLTVLGRNFTLTELDRPFLVGIFLLAALWFLGALLARPHEYFVPLAFEIVALLIAALAVDPFLYAALLIEIAVLLSIPMLSPPGASPGRGVFRFLTLQTFGIPFILFVGWLLEGVEASPSDLDLVVRAAVLIGLGFAFLLSIFPLHSWIPVLGSEVHPYVSAFVFLVFPGVISLFAISFLDRYAWLRDSAQVYDTLAALGALMALVGGVWAAFQNHLGRIMGYAAILEIGLSLQAISLLDSASAEIYFALFLPRALAFWVLGVTLATLSVITEGDLRLPALKGLAWSQPVLASSLLLAFFSLAGLPLLAAFPVRWALWNALSGRSSLVAGLTILASVGLLVAGLRAFFLLVAGDRVENSENQDVHLDLGGEPHEQQRTNLPFFSLSPIPRGLLYAAGGFVLILIGLVPQWLYPLLARLPGMFPQLVP